MKTFTQLAEEWLNTVPYRFSRDKRIVLNFAEFLDGLPRSAPPQLPGGAQQGAVSPAPAIPVADNDGDVFMNTVLAHTLARRIREAVEAGLMDYDTQDERWRLVGDTIDLLLSKAINQVKS